ncbi:MAG: hypothetical protein AAF443_00495 [Chlamydiota bacterium]
MIWRGYFDRLFSWVLIRQVDKTQGKIGQKRPSNSAIFLHFESAWVYSASSFLDQSSNSSIELLFTLIQKILNIYAALKGKIGRTQR